MAMNIASQCDQIDLDTGEQTPRDAGKLGQAIEMRIAEMQDAVAIEGRRQIGKDESVFDQTRRQRVAPPPSVKTGEPHGPAEEMDRPMHPPALTRTVRSIGIDPAVLPLHRTATRAPSFTGRFGGRVIGAAGGKRCRGRARHERDDDSHGRRTFTRCGPPMMARRTVS